MHYAVTIVRVMFDKLFVAVTDEGAASRSLVAVCDVTDIRHVVVSAHFDVAVFTSTARCVQLTVELIEQRAVAYPRGDMGACSPRSWKLAFVSGVWELGPRPHRSSAPGPRRPPDSLFCPP